MTPTILLVEDRQDNLTKLEEAIRPLLGANEANIHPWRPSEDDDATPLERLQKLHEEHAFELVVCDFDLTSGQKGLFGSSIVQWCQVRGIPAGDFTNDPQKNGLPERPNLFELRVPSDSKYEKTAQFVVSAFRGFRDIRRAIEADGALAERRSPATIIASLLGEESQEDEFAQYSMRFGFSNSALLTQLSERGEGDGATDSKRRRLLAYICGHLLLNAVLKYPGPILNGDALAAYVGVRPGAEDVRLQEVFAKARYEGPFSGLSPFFWTAKVDEILESLTSDAEIEGETIGSINRQILEKHLKVQLAKHDCPRCKGEQGGFICAFTNKVICRLGECSAPSNSWIPPGARLCRVERTFYDEWAPVLGL